MVTSAQLGIVAPSADQTLLALVETNGSAAHPYLRAEQLVRGRDATRNLADIVHHLTLLHGRYPGVIDHAGNHVLHPALRGWVLDAIDGFARERLLLAKLTVALGPLPSTPGQFETEQAVIAQRHALDMLAQSDRAGCALGAAAALIFDWTAIRATLALAAHRIGMDLPESTLPSVDDTAQAGVTVVETPILSRALNFGAQQLLAQHRGLWDLMAAREQARRED